MDQTRSIVARVSSATPDELAALLADPTEEQERVLRNYLGEARYQQMRTLALRVPATPVAAAERFWPFGGPPAEAGPRLGNVVVLPGIMGSELTSISLGGDSDLIWVNIPRIIIGRLARLRLRLLPDGRLAEYCPGYRIEPTGL